MNYGVNVIEKKLNSILRPPKTFTNLNFQEINYKMEKSLQLDYIEYTSY